MKYQLSVWICGLVFSGLVAAQQQDARKVPAQYGFPEKELILLQYLDRIDFINMRQHAWNVWAGITHQDSTDGAAVFESWYPASHVFYDDNTPPPALRSYKSAFEALNQHRFGVIGPGESHISHVMYNQTARDHIRDYKLYRSTTLTELNQQFDEAGTRRWNRTVPQFPRDSIVIKPVWWPVQQSAVTVLPVWDGPYEPKDPNGIYPPMDANDWPLAVAVVPPGVKSPANLSKLPRTNPGQTVRGINTLDDFYYFQITQAMIDKLSTEQTGFEHIKAGDYAVLVAMHVTTREISSWVWATFWWHDKPNQGSLALDRPETVQEPWSHFLMNTAFSMDTPGASDTGPHITYNPYIEGKFPNGVVSNCMACHNRASSPALEGELCGALPVTRGSYDYQPTSPQREGRVKLEFLWSLLFRSVEGKPACLDKEE